MKERTLRQRLTIANALLILAIVVLGVAAIWGLHALNGGIKRTADEYEEVQLLDRASAGVQLAVLELRLNDKDLGLIRSNLRLARSSMAGFLAYQVREKGHEDEHETREITYIDDILTDVDAVIHEIDALGDDLHLSPQQRVAMMKTLDPLEKDFDELFEETDVSGERARASQQLRTTILIVTFLSLLIVATAVLVSLHAHRQIIETLHRLQRSAKRIASGRFTERVEEKGDHEVVQLARDFNKMAAELDTLYRVMESRVEEKSRELVRSERLASVGFLAAGVAHEINNPLGIISGYASLVRKWIAGRPSEDQLRESQSALDIIGDEAFRCKKIVKQLMTLSIAGDDTREPVSLNSVVRELLAMVRGLDQSRDRRVRFERNGDAEVMVMGNQAELQQVVLNLIVNAFAATESNKGEVRIAINESSQTVQLIVSDNGCGLEPDTLEKLFEPFFSRSPRTETQGLGLGLTISYAIVERHGGRLSAQSDGPGLGSRFIIELPNPSYVEQRNNVA